MTNDYLNGVPQTTSERAQTKKNDRNLKYQNQILQRPEEGGIFR